MNKYSRIGFATKLGGLLAAAGSAIGLGNIWRFPSQAGQSGGSAFIIIYLLCVAIFGIPLLIAEFSIGRHARANVGNAYRVLAPNTFWKWVGPLSVLVAFLIFCYYNVVVGWVLYYTWDSLLGTFVSMGTGNEAVQAFTNHFNSFIVHPWKPILCLLIVTAMCHFVVVSGVQAGIEKTSKVLIPGLFIIMIFLAIFASFMPGAGEGYRFLFAMDFSAITPDVVLSALGQCFYSLSIGMGLITYASYFRRDVNLTNTAVSIAVMSSIIAVLAGIIIFPAVFSVDGMDPELGPGLVFVALPNVFNSALSSIPFLAWLIPLLFYIILLVAALTSTIFLHEVATAYVAETFGTTRHRAASYVTLGVLFLGIACSLSLGPWSEFKIFGLNIFDFIDSLTAKVILPITGLGASLFVGWKLSTRQLWTELTSFGTVRFIWVKPFLFLVRFFVPSLIILIMLSNFGLI